MFQRKFVISLKISYSKFDFYSQLSIMIHIQFKYAEKDSNN